MSSNRCIMCGKEISGYVELCPTCLNVRNNMGERTSSTMTLFNMTTDYSGCDSLSGVYSEYKSPYSHPPKFQASWQSLLSDSKPAVEEEETFSHAPTSLEIVEEVIEEVCEQKIFLDQGLYSEPPIRE